MNAVKKSVIGIKLPKRAMLLHNHPQRGSTGVQGSAPFCRFTLVVSTFALFFLGVPCSLAKEPLRVFIFAGQSNIFGADAVIDPSTVKDLAESNQQTLLDKTSKFRLSGYYPWGDIRGHCSGTFLANKPVKVMGPEVGFNRALGGHIVILMFTDNFNALEKGHSPWRSPGSLWKRMTAFIDQSLRELKEPYSIAGCVWDQGIDDACMHRDKHTYEADLKSVINDIRAKYGQIPFVLSRSVNSKVAGSTNMKPIREAQVEVGSMANNSWINVDDLGPYNNGHHLTAKAQLTAGERFANAWKKLHKLQ